MTRVKVFVTRHYSNVGYILSLIYMQHNMVSGSLCWIATRQPNKVAKKQQLPFIITLTIKCKSVTLEIV